MKRRSKIGLLNKCCFIFMYKYVYIEERSTKNPNVETKSFWLQLFPQRVYKLKALKTESGRCLKFANLSFCTCRRNWVRYLSFLGGLSISLKSTFTHFEHFTVCKMTRHSDNEETMPCFVYSALSVGFVENYVKI